MIEATCHCGAIKIGLPRKPRRLTDCNCSICRRYGTLWAYFPRKKCGCITHWEPLAKQRIDRMGVNARNLDPEIRNGIRVRRLDGASTWKWLD